MKTRLPSSWSFETFWTKPPFQKTSTRTFIFSQGQLFDIVVVYIYSWHLVLSSTCFFLPTPKTIHAPSQQFFIFLCIELTLCFPLKSLTILVPIISHLKCQTTWALLKKCDKSILNLIFIQLSLVDLYNSFFFTFWST